MARSMVTKWGLSEKLGPLQYEEDDQEVFLGKSAGSARSHVSGETAKVIDEEVKLIIDSCYEKARTILVDNRDKLDAMVDALLEYETIDRPQIDDIMAGRTPSPPSNWNDDPPSEPPTDSVNSDEAPDEGEDLGSAPSSA